MRFILAVRKCSRGRSQFRRVHGQPIADGFRGIPVDHSPAARETESRGVPNFPGPRSTGPWHDFLRTPFSAETRPEVNQVLPRAAVKEPTPAHGWRRDSPTQTRMAPQTMPSSGVPRWQPCILAPGRRQEPISATRVSANKPKTTVAHRSSRARPRNRRPRPKR